MVTPCNRVEIIVAECKKVCGITIMRNRRKDVQWNDGIKLTIGEKKCK